MKKFLRIILLITIIILSYKLFFNLGTVTYRMQEGIQSEDNKYLEYTILSEYTSKGAFVPSEPIKAKIEINSLHGRDFRDVEEIRINFGGIGTDAYRSPLKTKDYEYWMPMIDKNNLMFSEDYKTLKGEIALEFSFPGEYEAYIIIIKYLDGTSYTWSTSKVIPIEHPSILVQLKSYRLSMFALLISFLTLVNPIVWKKFKQI